MKILVEIDVAAEDAGTAVTFPFVEPGYPQGGR